MTKVIIPENVQTWLADLRSGEFTQGRSHLTIVDAEGGARHCCLGVYCHREAQEGTIRAQTILINGGYDTVVHYGEEKEMSNYSVLPISSRDRLGLLSESGSFVAKDIPMDDPIRELFLNECFEDHNSLAGLNDSGLVSFGQMADFIERNWAALAK